MTQQIPGVPDGWELVHAMRRAIAGEHYIGSDGVVRKCLSENESMYAYPIIRKIEKPARYRPFENAAEYAPHFDRAIKPKAVATMAMRVIKYSEGSVFFVSGLALNSSSYEDAFYGVEFDDGTPFGVKIDE
jgi:hypothetical protein